VDLLTQTALSPNSTTAQPVTSIANLDTTLTTVSQMLDSVLAYVRQVLAGEVEGDKALGRYLMDTLGVGPVGEKGGEDKAFNSSLQVRSPSLSLHTRGI
jgi:translation initiation factor 3 subunit F